jgi:hypothetical protein
LELWGCVGLEVAEVDADGLECAGEGVLAAALHLVPQRLQQFGTLSLEHPEHLLVAAILGQRVELFRLKLEFLQFGLVSHQQREQDPVLEGNGILEGEFLWADHQIESGQREQVCGELLVGCLGRLAAVGLLG